MEDSLLSDPDCETTRCFTIEGSRKITRHLQRVKEGIKNISIFSLDKPVVNAVD
jgi:hypothetical protein